MSRIITSINAWGKEYHIPIEPISGDYDIGTIGEDSENFDTYIQEQIEALRDDAISPREVVRRDYLDASFEEELDMPIEEFYEEITERRSKLRKRKHDKFCKWINEKECYKNRTSIDKKREILDPLMKELDQWIDRLTAIIDDLKKVDELKWTLQTRKVRGLEELAKKYLWSGENEALSDIPF